MVNIINSKQRKRTVKSRLKVPLSYGTNRFCKLNTFTLISTNWMARNQYLRKSKVLDEFWYPDQSWWQFFNCPRSGLLLISYSIMMLQPIVSLDNDNDPKNYTIILLKKSLCSITILANYIRTYRKYYLKFWSNIRPFLRHSHLKTS